MLNLCYCTQITDAGLKHLSALEELTNLELRCLVRITGIGITSIAIGCTSLIELDLKRCYSVDDAGLWALSRYSQNLRQVKNSKTLTSPFVVCEASGHHILLTVLFAAYYLLLSSHWPRPVPSAGLPEVPPGREHDPPVLGFHRRVRDGIASCMREAEEAEAAGRAEVCALSRAAPDAAGLWVPCPVGRQTARLQGMSLNWPGESSRRASFRSGEDADQQRCAALFYAPKE